MPPPFMGPSSRRFLAYAFGIAGVVALAATLRHHDLMRAQSRPAEYLTWAHAILQEVPYYLLWALAAPVVYWFLRYVTRARLRVPVRILAHIGFAVALILVVAATNSIVYESLAAESTREGLTQELVGLFTKWLWWVPSHLVTYCAVLGAVFAYDYSRRAFDRELTSAALATELAEARLAALRAQLHPHFVFNALNSVSMLVRGQRNDEAVQAVTDLSDLLRDVLDTDGSAEVPLEEEIAFVRRYLAVERIRFGDRVRVRIDAEAVKEAKVPRLLLQPLVENAIHHGVSASADAGLIEITAQRRGDQLMIVVRDDGPGPEDSARPSASGVGLGNTADRLAALYGESATLALSRADGGGAKVTVTLPYQHAGVRAA